jgi:short subunit dehydrogenase-like uncharacterized protein
MSDSLSIYGATGFTGRLLAEAAKGRGLRPILTGRDEGELRRMAHDLDLPFRTAALDDVGALTAALTGAAVLLNAAGPFSVTVEPLIEACLRLGIHYLDISAECAAIEAASRFHEKALRRKIMIMPAVGFDVVPSDCLAAHVAARQRGARRLAIGISGLQLMSRGSARTILEDFANPITIRRHGRLESVAPGTLEHVFDYGRGARKSVAVGWGDVASAYYTTGIPDISVYFEATLAVRATVQAKRVWGPMLGSPWSKLWWQAHLPMVPPGPSSRMRAERAAVLVAEAEDAHGQKTISRLRTPEAYTMTAMTAPAVAERVLAGDLELGFQTPAKVYGADFVLSFPGVTREDLH